MNIEKEIKEIQELVDMLGSRQDREDFAIISNFIKKQKAELEKKDEIIDLIVEDFQNEGYLKGMSREEILDYYQERLWLNKQRNPLPLKLDIVG